MEIIHNQSENCFEVTIDNMRSIVGYCLVEGEMHVTHTMVPKELSGQGIAAALTKELLQYAQQQQLRIKPICPYTKAYLERHPEYDAMWK